MPYVIVDRTIREVIATDLNKPVITDPNQLGIEVPNLNNIAIRHMIENPQTTPGSYGISYIWISGTAYTQAEIDAETARQTNNTAQLETAIASVIASVNGKAATSITAADAIKLVLLLAAQQGWIDGTGKIAVSQTLQGIR